MLPHTRAWSSSQKWLVIVGSIVSAALAGSGVCIYERYYRGPSDSVVVGTWRLEDGCIDCTHLISLQPNHNVVGFSDAVGRENCLDYHGRWYVGGQILVIHYNNLEEAQSIVMHILDVSPDALRVRWNRREMRMLRSARTPPPDPASI